MLSTTAQFSADYRAIIYFDICVQLIKNYNKILSFTHCIYIRLISFTILRTKSAKVKGNMANLYRGEFIYDGTVYDYKQSEDTLVSMKNKVTYSEDDVVVASYPKSGIKYASK